MASKQPFCRAMLQQAISILMYHSISDGSGPTCIAPETFRGQMRVLADCGYRTVALSQLAEDRSHGRWPLERTVVLTFDDGFADFAAAAAPELARRGWSATVFLPAAKIGGVDDWESGSRPLMTWKQVSELANAGIEFGSHTATHRDLTTLADAALRDEITGSKEVIESRLGAPVTTFAAPFGRTNAVARRVIEATYRTAAGTRLAKASPASDPYDLPRIEMCYFRALPRWRAYLSGAKTYLRMRQVMRQARVLLGAG